MEDQTYNQILNFKRECIYPPGVMHKSNFDKVCGNYELNAGRNGLLRNGKVVVTQSMLPKLRETFIVRNKLKLK